MHKIRLLIASAHVIVRTALGTLLKAVRDFDVVGEVDLSHLVKTPVQLSPDVFLVELAEAGLRGRLTWRDPPRLFDPTIVG
jgi:DNA-binding NarL/FixJ family response regulator